MSRRIVVFPEQGSPQISTPFSGLLIEAISSVQQPVTSLQSLRFIELMSRIFVRLSEFITAVPQIPALWPPAMVTKPLVSSR